MPKPIDVRRLAAAVPLCALLAACLSQAPIVPYPDVAYVPHPLKLSEAQALEDLLETYSASPNRNPDGLGVLQTLWLNSRITLVTWQMALATEARNRLAYARTPAEHTRALADARALYGEHWVFEGVLLGDLANVVTVDFYQPHGVYLVNDRGRKFYPVSARDTDPIVGTHVVSSFGDAHYRYPRLVFPHEAIGPDTRSVSLYFAALNRRLRFTWVFDPAYVPPAGGPGLDSGAEQNRLFRAR